MTRLIQMTLAATVVGATTLLGLSIWPGALSKLLLFGVLFAVVWVPIALGSVTVAAVVIYRRRARGTLGAIPMRQLAAIPIVAIATLALLKFSVPRRAAFVASLSGFEQLAASAPGPGAPDSEIRAQVGPYVVDKLATDPRGGIFLRVNTGPDGLGPDEMSYGFVREPNGEGTPFGNARYAAFPVVGEWYWFRASNDY